MKNVKFCSCTKMKKYYRFLSDKEFERNGIAQFKVSPEYLSGLTVATRLRFKVRIGRLSGKNPFVLKFFTNEPTLQGTADAFISFFVVSRPPKKPATPEKLDPRDLETLKKQLKTEIDLRGYTREDINKLLAMAKRLGKKEGT